MKTMKKCNRKLLSILLVLCMVLTIVPITALAAEWENLDFLPQGVTHSTEYKNPYHTQVNVTANVIVKGSDGTVVETTQVSKSSEDFVKGNLNDEAVLTALANLQTEIETPYKAKGTVTSENGGGQLTVDHFESATFYIFTPTSGDPVDFSTDLDAAKQYFNDHTDAVGTFTRILDVHEYLKWDYTYDLIVQKPGAVDEEVITTVDIGNIWKNLDSSQPVVFTTELNPNTDCPNQMEITDQAWVENDSSASISSNAYPEAGKEYVYEITLTAKEGYYFPTYGTVFYGEVIVDGVEKYSYGHGDAVPNVYDNGKTLKVKVYPAVIATNGTSQGDTTIDNAYIENVKFDYRPGDAPQATAQVSDTSLDQYEIAYECWEEMENGEPVAFWYSNESKYTPSMKKITQFEEGKNYMYSIELREKDGYIFADNCSVTINWNPISATANVVKTVDGLFAMNVKTIRPQVTKEISVIEINNVTLTFKDGDKPVFTGTVPENDQYAFRCEWWSLDENTGIVSTEPEWGGDIYTNKITAFETGKTYHYGVYVTAYTADISPDAKLKINGREVEYTRIGDENDTQSFWVETDLSMTPTAAGASDYKIIEGANGAWTQNGDGTLTFRANGDFSKFTGVKVDGTLIDAKNYTAVSGSTVITLKADYLKTLSVGTHKLTVVYTDGECSANFEVKKAASEQAKPSEGDKSDTTTPTGGKDTTSPQTGDNSNLALWFALMLASILGVGATLLYGRKRKFNR
ncbi:MAG: X2-like carbohydrate binding domain-containing protein [Agathobaculum sp.]|uniref:X2-like carbohydrate binding domain-containing protein n=2 Tax=Clostridia TaxID=186801 RepID=UPI002A7FDD21|nr:X2-like carbohydrate binding domain-containing protein [Agathobaculum sp.]MDY3711023.1 X2-like carbohydrate binding domain-containing protein [Agathobaculum sp.]MDY5617558.1 X2-like carbohydrate binding domain-containing protein [Lachnospiraceae bacterium]